MAVSIHAPAGGATKALFRDMVTLLVSIHAPAGGATAESDHDCDRQLVSIHAPAGGATKFFALGKSSFLFQSTRLREARPASQ